MSVARALNSRIVQLAASRRLPRRTVRVRLTLLYGGLFLISGAALVAITYLLFQQATQYAKPRLPSIPRTPAIARLKPLTPPKLPPLPQLEYDQTQLAQDRHRLEQVHLSLGKAVLPVGRTGPGLQLSVPRLAEDQNRLGRDQHQLAHAVDQLAQAVHQVARTGSIEAAQRAADSHALLVNSGIALAIVAVLALLAGWLLAGRMLRPIRTITRTAQRISSRSLHERVAVEGPNDELKELGDTLDGLFARLEAAFEAQQQFVANASHELRAPLTRQRALIQVALADPDASLTSLRATHERVLAAEQHLEQTIDGLLALTRGQAGLEHREDLDLATLADQLIRVREPETASLGLDVRVSLAPAPLTGDPRLLERLIANLIDNALGHNAHGGHLEITTGTREQHSFLNIANSGPTIPGEEVPRLMQPFQRLHGTRATQAGGRGLGLAIVGAIANAHRATLTVKPRAGGGLIVEVSFPGSAQGVIQTRSTTRAPVLRPGAASQA